VISGAQFSGSGLTRAVLRGGWVTTLRSCPTSTFQKPLSYFRPE